MHTGKVSLRVSRNLHTDIITDFRNTIRNHFHDYDGYRWRYLDESLLSKFVGPETAPASVRRDRAIEKWLSQENRNRKTNIRLYGGNARFKVEPTPITAWDIEERARRTVLKVIGRSPKALHGSFSSGASTRLKRDTGNGARKYVGNPDVTARAWPYVLPMILESTAWFTHNPSVLKPRFVAGNVMFTVPKNTDIDRVACKEPDLNMWAQKACGDAIRRALKRAGVDLNSQLENQHLARLGSLWRHLATIDLSSASDSVTTSLVARLLPPAWFDLLNALRCEVTILPDGSHHENAMFSSMGNGFTFELESLLFFAIVKSIRDCIGDKGIVSVYGDDIIAPKATAEAFIRWCGYWGFKANAKKSFVNGPFRESCGAHWYDGENVTPIYVREPIDSVERLIHFLNRVRKWAGQWDGIWEQVCDDRLLPFYQRWSKHVPRELKGGPSVYSTVQLASPHTPRMRLAKVERPISSSELRDLQTGLYLEALGKTWKNPSLNPRVTQDPMALAVNLIKFSRHRSHKAVSNDSDVVGPGDDLAISEEIASLITRLGEGKNSRLVRTIERWTVRRAPRRLPKQFAMWNCERPRESYVLVTARGTGLKTLL